MRIILIIILVCIIAGSFGTLSAQDFVKNFNSYEYDKKEMATGYLWSTIIPGGGFFYSDRLGTGCFFLVGEIVFYSLAKSSIDDKPKDDHGSLYIIGFLIKGVEYILVTDAIKEENKLLRERLKLTTETHNDYLGIKLSYNF